MFESIQPHLKQMLHVDTLKNGSKVNIYVECSGNKLGIPVIYLHGGPGDHVTPRLRRLYNPKQYHIILFDQRGCGQSKPLNHTEKNTTQHLIQDMETIRHHLKIDKWVVSGGSWGSSLALLYAQAYPNNVLALLLRGVYDLSQEDVLDEMYPEHKDELYHLLHVHKKKQLQSRINSALSHKTKTRKRLIQLMSDESPMYVFTPSKKSNYKENETLTIIGNHYELHHYFVPKRTIYDNMHKIRHIPTIMLEGRYDMITPMKIAYTLSKLFDDCDLTIVRAGHTILEDSMTKAYIKKTNQLIRRLR